MERPNPAPQAPGQTGHSPPTPIAINLSPVHGSPRLCVHQWTSPSVNTRGCSMPYRTVLSPWREALQLRRTIHTYLQRLIRRQPIRHRPAHGRARQHITHQTLHQWPRLAALFEGGIGQTRVDGALVTHFDVVAPANVDFFPAQVRLAGALRVAIAGAIDLAPQAWA